MHKKPEKRPMVRLGKPIIVRAFVRGRSRRPAITIKIGRPRPLPGRDWVCPVVIQATGRKASPIRQILGVDGFQALTLALEYVRVNLTIPPQDLRFLGRPAGADFPLLFPYDLSDQDRARIERLLHPSQRRRANGRHGNG
jgi:hypothetical protein